MEKEPSQREQQLEQVSLKVFDEIWQKRIVNIKKDYEINRRQYDNEIIEIMHNLLLSWEHLYKDQEKNLKYVIISPLSSGVITRSYELQIALFDQELYVEENPLCAYWTPKFIYKDMEEDMALCREKVSKEIIRIREDEVYEMHRRYALCHAYAVMFYMDEIMWKVYELPVWLKIAVQDVKIMYGTYMERMMEIGKIRKEEEQ